MPESTKPQSAGFRLVHQKPLQWSIAVGVLTAAVVVFLPNYYRSELRLLPVESKGLGGNLGGLANAAAALGVNMPGGDSNDANFVDVLNSRWMKEQLLQTQFKYRARTWRFGSEQVVRGTLYDYVGEGNMDRAVKKLGDVLSASRDVKSKVITLGAETKSPELSQLLVKQSGRLLETFLQEKGRTRGGAKALYAEARLLDARKEMDEAEDAFLRFLVGNRNYQASADPAVRLKGTRLENELRLRQQLVSTLAMNREQALLEEKNDIPILNVLDPGHLPIEKSRPSRAILVLLVTLLTGMVSWLKFNLEWVRSKVASEDRDASSVLPRAD